ncbi:MAG: 2-succinyl-6-hydroxy-2,4-cyclohexadiene-1-carboxylate synthase [Gemmatimonadota bacterium]
MTRARDPGSPIRVLEIGPAGESVPLLLLHGFTGSARAWGAALLGALSAGRQVLAADLPGHGETPALSDPEDDGIEAVAKALAGALDQRGIDRADWVGYSMGGRVALAAAVTAPERVRRLVLESASPGIEEAAAREERREEDEALSTRIERLGMGWFVDYWMGQPIFDSQHRLSMKSLEETRALRLRNRPSGLAAALRGYGLGAQPSYWGALSSLRHPTLVLTGALDEKFTEIGARMAKVLPRGTHRSVENAGHAIHLEDPEGWLAEVTAFLNETGEEAGSD